MPPDAIPRRDGRRLFGVDAARYDVARPDYPDALYELLAERCGLGPGARTLEVGAGSGLATRRLVERGANPIVAVEPDPTLAERLRATTPRDRVDVRVVAFEEAILPDATFDLAVSATAFHWVEPSLGLAKVYRALRPGGAWAMWWNVFGDPAVPDPFHEATQHLLAALPTSPSHGAAARAPHALDRTARLAELAAAGFTALGDTTLRWTLTLDPAGVRALYGTFASINQQPAAVRERLLDALASVAADEFRGHVERRMLTPCYFGRRPTA